MFEHRRHPRRRRDRKTGAVTKRVADDNHVPSTTMYGALKIHFRGSVV